jgi:5-methylcytosine-specific restriction endonuclease McrA
VTRPRQRPTPALRLAVYTRAGFKCQGCGWAPPVPVPYNPRYCLADVMPNGRTYTLDVDHVIPYSAGGRLTLDNTQALCTGCNNRKGVSL